MVALAVSSVDILRMFPEGLGVSANIAPSIAIFLGGLDYPDIDSKLLAFLHAEIQYRILGSHQIMCETNVSPSNNTPGSPVKRPSRLAQEQDILARNENHGN